MSFARARSAIDFYHVMQRGVGLYDIFEDDADRDYYLRLLREAMQQNHMDLHAWCLMSNHTHLLVHAEYSGLPIAMREIGSRYARYFNERHSRPGHLFQGRYNSVPVEDDTQFLGTMRYIHRNPYHHDGRTLTGEFPWSSYTEYLDAKGGLTSTGMALDMLGGVKAFAAFHELEDRTRYLDSDSMGSPTDDEARKLSNEALESAGFSTEVTQLGRLPRIERDKALRLLLSMNLGYRQVQRLSGVNYNAVRNVGLQIKQQ